MVLYPLPCYLAFEVTLYCEPWARPGQKIICGLAQTVRAGWFLITSGQAGLQKCWPCHL